MTWGQTIAVFTAILKISALVMLPIGLVALFVAVLLDFSISESVTLTILMYLSVALPIGGASVGLSAVLDQEEREEKEALLDQKWHADSS
jgi:hypothetical protein